MLTTERRSLLRDRRQIHEATWSKQCSMWSSLILEYGCAKGIYELSIDSETTSKAPFFNAAINSTCPVAAAQLALCANRRGLLRRPTAGREALYRDAAGDRGGDGVQGPGRVA